MEGDTNWFAVGEKISQLIGAFSAEDIDAVAKEFAYVGFEPTVIIKKIVRGRSASECQEDILSMIVIAVTRGNNHAKIKKNASVNVLAKINRLIDFYKIKDGRPERQDTVTFARIALAFGDTTLKLLPHLGQYLPVQPRRMLKYTDGYPVQMMHSAFAGYITSQIGENNKKLLVSAFCLYMLEFSRTIAPADKKNRTRRMIIAEFMPAVEASITSEFVPHEKRLATLLEFGIVTGPLDNIYQLKTSVVVAGQKYEALELDEIPY
ncbi:hypothetical protein DMENIID0001_012810 [Sergentomyia squamirostris]